MNSQQNNDIEVIDIKITRRFIANDSLEVNTTKKAEATSNKPLSARDVPLTKNSGTLHDYIRLTPIMAKNLLNLRHNHLLTLGSLSKRSGVISPAINKYERRCVKRLRVATLEKVVKALGITITDLMEKRYDPKY